MLLTALLQLCSCGFAADLATSPAATVAVAGSEYVLDNGYVRVVFSTAHGAAISSLRGDFEGGANFGEELLAATGYSLQARSLKDMGLAAAAASPASTTATANVTVTIVSNRPTLVSIAVDGVTAGGAVESWAISLAQGARAFELNTTGSMAAAAPPNTVVFHSIYTTPLSVFGFFPDDGVVQMMNGARTASFMPTNRTLGRVYMLGGVNPLIPHPGPNEGSQGSVDIVRQTKDVSPSAAAAGEVPVLTMLFSRADPPSQDPNVGPPSGAGAALSGMLEVVAGGGGIDPAGFDVWTDPFAEKPIPPSPSPSPPPPPPTPSCHFRETGGCSGTGPRTPKGDKPCDDVIPCQHGACPSGYCECAGGVKKHPVSCKVGGHPAFTCKAICAGGNKSAAGGEHATPATGAIDRVAPAGTHWSTSAMIAPNSRNFPVSGLPTDGANLPSDDLAAVMTGIYGTAPGCLCTFPNAPACPKLSGKRMKLGQIATTVARSNEGTGADKPRGYFGTCEDLDTWSSQPIFPERSSSVALGSLALRLDSLLARVLPSNRCLGSLTSRDCVAQFPLQTTTLTPTTSSA